MTLIVKVRQIKLFILNQIDKNKVIFLAQTPFCPKGKTADIIPIMEDSDVIEVYALKKPVWSFKFGPLLKYFVSTKLIV